MIKKAGLLLSLVLVASSSVFAADAESEKALFTKARALFEQKKFDDSIALYNQVTPKSDRWLLAVEEKAWAYMHLDQYNKAMSEAETLTTPALSAITGTEPFLLKTLISLRICDYSAIFQTLKQFKAQKRDQIAAIQELSKTGKNSVSRATLEKWILNTQDWKALGASLAQMPQLFYHDQIMLREGAKKNMPALEKRLKELAIIENNENFRILQKLNLIEVESVQRVHVASQFDRKQGEKMDRTDYDLVFKDDKEVWLDEIGSYQSMVNRCQKKSGRTM